MLKARIHGFEKEIVLLGLDGVNINRLKRDQPIHFEGSALLMESDVDILYGDTTAQITKLYGTPMSFGDFFCARGLKKGRDTVIFGLTKKCVKRLKKGDAIKIAGNRLKTDYDVYIVYGKTLADIVKKYNLPSAH